MSCFRPPAVFAAATNLMVCRLLLRLLRRWSLLLLRVMMMLHLADCGVLHVVRGHRVGRRSILRVRVCDARVRR